MTAVRSIDGGAQAAATGTVTELGNGQYVLALSQADTNGNDISFLFTATGAVPVEKTIVTTNSGTLAVTAAVLADAVAHGGTLGSSTATFALSRMSVVSQTTDTDAVTFTGNGTGDGLQTTGGASGGAGANMVGGAGGHGLLCTGGSGTTFGIAASGSGAGAGMNLFSTNGYGLWISSTNNVAAFIMSASNNAMSLLASGAGSGIVSTGAGAGHGMSLVAGATGDGLRLATTAGSGFRADVFLVSGTTTLTGAVTASNASNNINLGLVDSTYDVKQYLKAIGSTTAGASSGGPTTPAYKTLDGLVTGVTGTADADGNRSGITYNL